MEPANFEGSFSPFVLTTKQLIIVPTPIAIASTSYKALYGSLHGDPSFCEMAFGHHLPARKWSPLETQKIIEERDVVRCWKRRGMGDFAVGLRPAGADNMLEASAEIEADAGAQVSEGRGRLLQSTTHEARVIEGHGYGELIAMHGHDGVDKFLDTIEWVGYAGVRDATTTSMPDRDDDDPPLPPWLEMIEVRYGVGPAYWGRGIAKAAMETVMAWAAEERGVKRFIAETEKENRRSGRVLEKMGFRLSGTEYWKEPSEVEWERYP